jgi:hypothetical protein
VSTHLIWIKGRNGSQRVAILLVYLCPLPGRGEDVLGNVDCVCRAAPIGKYLLDAMPLVSHLRFSAGLGKTRMLSAQIASPLGADPLARLPQKERRGSRARCILLTDGPDVIVAHRLSVLAGPSVIIDPNRHNWMPRGIAHPKEAKLGDALSFLSDEHREAVVGWWLAVRKNANTPNWDIVSTGTIDGIEGLVLVEAKAHSAEIKVAGKPAGPKLAKTKAVTGSVGAGPDNSARNHVHIAGACREASDALDRVLPGWALSIESHYQLCNRFAWSWKIASLGVPVVLIYLGFLHAEEMRDQGPPFDSAENWERLVRDHSQGIVPRSVWDHAISIQGTPVRALIRSMEIDLSGVTASFAPPTLGPVLL